MKKTKRLQQDQIVERAQSLFERDKEYWNPLYQKARDDLRFMSDEPGAQWNSQDYNDRLRSGRPAITIDNLGQFVKQVVNSVRMNTPTINVLPSDAESSLENAKAYKGLIRAIEYKSDADEAYDTAILFSVGCSIGFLRVDNYYADENEEGLQELKICRVTNPFSIYLDSKSTEADGSDAKHAFALEKITVDEFKQKYPDADPVSFVDDDGFTPETCTGSDYLTIAEFFKRENRMVKRYKLSGAKVLEETVFPGYYIPIVPVYGEEQWIDGKRNLLSLIRKSKESQMVFNYWKSLEMELLMKQPNAPVMAAEGQVEDYAEDWKNPTKAAVLRYKATDSKGNLIGKPDRLAPPTIPTGIVNAARETVEDIKSTMGLYNAALGQTSNETSGIAIQRRKQEGAVATFHFGDNLNRSITQVGKVLVSAIPVVYDTPRVLQIIGEEDDVKAVGVNGLRMEDQEEEYNLQRGKYDVRVTSGASFTTLRQEAAETYMQLMTQQPELMKVIGDLAFKSMDFPGAQAMAERIKRTIPRELLAEDDEDEIDPEKMQLQQALQQMQAQMAELQSKVDNTEAKNMIEAAKVKNDADAKQAEIAIKAKELALKEKELDLKIAQAVMQQEQAQKALEIRAMSESVANNGTAPMSGENIL